MRTEVSKSRSLSGAVSRRDIVKKVVEQVTRMVAESGEPAGFDATAWVNRWLQEPNPALGNRRPDEFLDDAAGRVTVFQLLALAQSGAYA